MSAVDLKFSLKEATLKANGQSLEKVFTILLDNAIKYTNQGGRIGLKLQPYGGCVQCIVSDTGVGIKKEDLSRIFDKFQRLSQILEHKKRGVGLGLAIVKEIIVSHGGKIWVESELNKGSKFIFVLPGGLRREDKRYEEKENTPN